MHFELISFEQIHAFDPTETLDIGALLANFGRLGGILKESGKVVLYGPFKYPGEFTTPSNAAFDLLLKSRDPVSGIRDFEAVDVLARGIGLQYIVDHPMPANNQLIVWGR